MPEFEEPSFVYDFDPAAQITALQTYRDTKPGRKIPKKKNKKLLVGSWNIANLGAQERKPKHYKLLGEVCSWFDIVAIQECRDDLSGLRGIVNQMPAGYQLLFSDVAGNDERMAFIYDSAKIERLEMAGEVAVAPASHRHVKLPGIEQKFRGFDRNPYVAAFRAGTFTFVLVNVHLYFGSDSTRSKNRRSLETYAVGRWADLRRKSDTAYAKDIIVLGDFNMPKAEPGDPIYEALTDRGLAVPDHSSKIATSISTANEYDQLAFFPGETGNDFTGKMGVFDFDGAVFPDLYGQSEENFKAYLRYYLSDHRPIWAQFKIAT